MDDLLRKLRLIKEEDFIWIIYFFIITFAIISNYLERDSLINKNQQSSQKSQKINTTILIVAFIIYLYFAIATIDNFDLLVGNGTKKEIRVANERLIANLLFVAAGAVALYAAFDNNNTFGTDIAIF